MAGRNDTPFLQLDLPFGPHEAWKPVPGYEGFYEVSNMGQVRSIRTGTILKPQDFHGYKRVRLFQHKVGKGMGVHVLVLSTFVSPRPHGLQANHIDGNKSNNALDNLEWITAQENILHSISMGLTPVGERHHRAKLTVEEVQEIRSLYAQGAKIRALARRFGVGHRSIAAIVHRKSWKSIA